MSVDPYAPCPCGGGKKIKFCCSSDIAAEVDRVVHALESGQRAAALDQINRLIASQGERDALLAVKGEVLIQLGNMEEAQETANRFLESAPDNPTALALSAILETDDHAAITKLQRAFEKSDQAIAMSVFNALAVLGRRLASNGDILSAKRHLSIEAAVTGGAEENQALEFLMRLQSSPQIPLLMKQDLRLAERSPDALWGEAFDEAMNLARRGAWLAGAEKLEALAEQSPNEAVILRNIAIFRSWLGDPSATVAAWRRYAALPEVPANDAVEAEALAQLLDDDAESETLEVVSISYPINNNEQLLERLLSDGRSNKMPIDLNELGDEDEPPPSGAFWLLDRELPATGKEITRDAVPNVLGEMYLYGRQTDREAELRFDVTRNGEFESKKLALAELTGDLIGDESEEEVTDEVPLSSDALTWNWRFPDDTPVALRSRLIGEQRREVMLNKWPDTPLAAADGKRPREVADDPAYQVKLLAAILLLELAGENQDLPDMDFNELRTKLGLPPRDTVDPWKVAVKDLSVVQLAKVDVTKLSDDDLVSAFERAGTLAALAALRRLAPEVVARESLDQRVDKSQVHQMLARLSRSNEEAFEHFQTARELAVSRGDPAVQWLLGELQLRLERSELSGCDALIEQIWTGHRSEPGVAEAFEGILQRNLGDPRIGQGLYEMLVRCGIIEAEPESSVVAAGESETAGSKLWTPDSDSAPSEASEGKSKLWVPGMD